MREKQMFTSKVIAFSRVLITALVVLAAPFVKASPISPTFDTFGDLAEQTDTTVSFGGSGIPTNPSAIGTFTATAQNGDTLLLGLTAHQRFSENPPLTNDGNGTFFATAGQNTPGSDPTQTLAATWNFAWFAELIRGDGSTSTLSDYGVTLFYDLDPGSDTLDSAMGQWNLGVTLATFTLPDNLFQSSQNSTFDFLTQDSLDGAIDAPDFTAFDPSATGEYSFALRSSLGEVAIQVNVNAVPLPGSLYLVLVGCAVLGATRHRRLRKHR